jgi:hypothetical protein
VWLLVVRLRGDEHVDTELEARRFVSDLISALFGGKPLLQSVELDAVDGLVGHQLLLG